MGPVGVIVFRVNTKQPMEMRFAYHDNMVQQVPTERPDDAPRNTPLTPFAPKRRRAISLRGAMRVAAGPRTVPLEWRKEIFGVSGAHIRDSVVSRGHTADAHRPRTPAKSREFRTAENLKNIVISID